MSVNTYKMTAVSGSVSGHILVTYKQRFLYAVEFNIEVQFTAVQFEWIMKSLPQIESYFLEFYEKNARWKLDNLDSRELSSSEKIAMFCRMYSIYKGGQKYIVSAADSGKIKLISLTNGILEFYFRSPHWLIKDRHSIAHLVRYWNEVQALQKGLEIKLTKDFPDYWDPEFSKKLEGNELIKYRKHLRSLGWTATKNRITGDIIGWDKPPSA